MKNYLNGNRLLPKAGFFSTAMLFLSMLSYNAFSQTTQPPTTTPPPPAGQPPKMPPETQPQPAQQNPSHKQIGKDTVKHTKKATPPAKPDTLKKTPPPRITEEYYKRTD